MVIKRLGLTLINIVFPPLGVALLCGPETDLIMNCILFLFAIIPSHIHAFYISCTYFNRKKKVRKGVYPGKWRRFIYSERVQNGGASSREVARLKMETIEGRKMGYEDLDRVSTRRRGYDGEGGLEKVKSRSRSRTRNSGYGGDMQQIPGRNGTRISGYENGARTSGYGSDVQHAPSRKTMRQQGYANDMQQIPSRSRTRHSGYDVQDVPDRRSSRRVLEV